MAQRALIPYFKSSQGSFGPNSHRLLALLLAQFYCIIVFLGSEHKT